MITKFEKRVIALLLAAVMCIPMTALSTMTVSAEDTGAAVVQEQSSTEEAQEPEGDVQENDGAFIPLEEEEADPVEDEAADLKEEAAEQQSGEVSEEIQQAAKLAYADVPDEELPRIELSDDGEPVRTETEFGEDDYSVRYIFQPKEDGYYYYTSVGNSGGWSIWHKTDNGDENWETLPNIYETGKMKKGDTYYIDIYSVGENSYEYATWDFGKVVDIEPGRHVAEINRSGQRRVYRLKYGDADTYCFKMLDYSIGYAYLVSGDRGIWANNNAATYTRLDQNKDTFIEVALHNPSVSENVEWWIQETDIQDIPLGETITTYYESDDAPMAYRYTAETSGRYKLSNGGMCFYDSEWNLIKESDAVWASPKKEIYIEAGETYYVLPVSSGEQKIVWKLEKVQNFVVEIDTDYTAVREQAVSYEFTAPETGRYYIGNDENLWMYLKRTGEGVNEENAQFYGRDNYYALEQGETYEVVIEFSSWSEVEEAVWSIHEASMEDVKAETEYTSKENGYTEYRFVPEKDGKYIVSSSNLGYSRIYDEEWNDSSFSSFDDKSGFDVTGNLKAGKTYYIHVISREDTARFRIDPIVENDEYSYRVMEDGTLELLDYTGEFGHVEIPETIDGKKVSRIGQTAFYSYQELESVTIPKTVTDLQYAAFAGCHHLKEVQFAEGSQLKKIGAGAFMDSESLTNIELPNGVETLADSAFTRSGLTSIVLPDSVKGLGKRVFESCNSLSEVDFGKGIKQIGEEMFWMCQGFENMDIPDSITSIGNGAFAYSALKSVAIPDSVTEIGDYVFTTCESLTSVKFGKGMKGISNSMFSGCAALTEIDLPENITYIETSAFSNTGLTKVDIPDTVTSVGVYAFSNCTKLTDVTIGNELAYIAQGAFISCDLKNLVIGDKVEKIEIRGFFGNENLETVKIPNSVTEIEYFAFQGCTKLLEIEIPDSVEAIGKEAFGGTAWYDAQENGLVYAGKVLYKYKGEIPEGSGDIELKEDTKGIAGQAFMDQKALTSITIPDSVTNIGANAFTGCESLTKIEIPQTVTRIDENAMGYVSEDGRPIEGFTIYGKTGSAAERYAKDNGFKFESTGITVIKGDVNGDNNVDIADLRMVLRSVCNKVTLDEMQTLAANVEADDKIDINDLRKILRFICRKIESLD